MGSLTAASGGIWFLPTYLGPTLGMALAWLVVLKMIRIARSHRITSIADFIASRYGKSHLLGGLVTIIAVVGIIPYIALQRKAVFRVYSMLAPNDPATARMNEWLNGAEESSPFKRAAKETVSIEIASVLPQTPETWQVDWVETSRDRQGILKGQPFRMRALVTVYVAEPTTSTSEEQIRNNPIGLYVRDFSWAKQL